MASALALCADDFGLSEAVDEGIVELAQRGRLSALSCLVQALDSPPAGRWPAAARRLREVPANVSCGLHFNLTEGVPASAELRRLWPVFPTLLRLIAAAHIGALPLAALAEEWRVQRDRFAAATGRAPDFIDGHQHVHHLCGVRALVLDAREGAAPLAVRNTGHVPGPGFALKRWAIEASGGRALMRALSAQGTLHNDALMGVYDFREQNYRGLMRRWLHTAARERGTVLLMCHPAAAASATTGDPIAATRVREAAYLGGPAFDDDLQAAGLALSPS